MQGIDVPETIEKTPEGLITAINNSIDNARPILEGITPRDIGPTSVRHERPLLRSRGNTNLTILDDGSLFVGGTYMPHNIAIYYGKTSDTQEESKLSDGRTREEVAVGVTDDRDTKLMLEVDVARLVGHAAVEGLSKDAKGKVRLNYFTLSNSGKTKDSEGRVQATGYLVDDKGTKLTRVIFSDLKEPLSDATNPNDTRGHQIRAEIIRAFDKVVDVLLKGAKKSTEESLSVKLRLPNKPIQDIRETLRKRGYL